MVKVKVENLVKIFGGDTKLAMELLNKGFSKDEILKKTSCSLAVANASFEVREGEVLVIMGLSGSGKSTVVRCLNRLINSTSGSVLIDNKNIMDVGLKELLQIRRKKFSMVFQRFGLLPHKTVLKNVQFGLEIQGVKETIRKSKAMEALNLVGLENYADSYPSQLSGGMQQRVGLARALATDPDMLLMDEAFSALDPLIRRQMQDELLALQDKVNKTIIFITHDLDEAIKLGDRIILMKDGRIVQEGTAEDILTNPVNEYVEKFVEHVDVSKVITAQAVMKPISSLAFVKDGPHTVLHKMKEHGISTIFVVDRKIHIKGVITAEDADYLIKNNIKDISSRIQGAQTVELDMPLSEVLQVMHTAKFPLAVVDDEGKALGIIVRGAVIAGLVNKTA